MSNPVRMPVALFVLLVLLGLGVFANLLNGDLLSAGIGTALLIGLLVGNDGVRKFMQFLAFIQIVWNAILVVRAADMKAPTWAIGLWVVIGIVLPAFMIWTLSRPNVREWMFRKNFHLDESPLPTATVESERSTQL